MIKKTLLKDIKNNDKTLWAIEGYQFVRDYITSFDDIETFKHLLWCMDFEQKKEYIENIFQDIHKLGDGLNEIRINTTK